MNVLKIFWITIIHKRVNLKVDITYKTIKDFSVEDLVVLFESVEWSSAKFPDKLRKSLKNSDTVLSAWCNDKLIGLINCISDKSMIAYFHYLLVNPEYQGLGIGKTLLKQMLEIHKDCETKILISYKEKTDFYEKNGFVSDHQKTPMFITSIDL